MKLSNMDAWTRGVRAELIVQFDGIHFEAIRLGIGDEAADVAQRLRALAARIEHRAADGVAAAPVPLTEPEPQLVGYEECRCILTQYCDGTCRPVFALPAAVERAKTLYANSPGAYRGTRPLPWPEAPLATRQEFIEKAKIAPGVVATPMVTSTPTSGGTEGEKR